MTVNRRARDLAAMWPHRWVGFFEEEFTGRPFSLDDYADPSWAPPDIASIVNYLRSTPVALATTGGDGTCARCGELVNSAAYHFDGRWLWPDDLAHVVARHAVVLPDRFVADIRAHNYEPPVWDSGWSRRLPWPQEAEPQSAAFSPK